MVVVAVVVEYISVFFFSIWGSLCKYTNLAVGVMADQQSLSRPVCRSSNKSTVMRSTQVPASYPIITDIRKCILIPWSRCSESCSNI